MKIFPPLLPLIVFLQINTFPLGLSHATKNDAGETITSPGEKTFTTSFISLKRGHTIASSCLTFGGEKRFEIKTPGEDFLRHTGSYTKNGLLFEARFEATLLKQKKHYRYTFTIRGISLLDSYIAGFLVLNEAIEETQQKQEVSFLFLGRPEGAQEPGENRRNLFPF